MNNRNEDDDYFWNAHPDEIGYQLTLIDAWLRIIAVVIFAVICLGIGIYFSYFN